MRSPITLLPDMRLFSKYFFLYNGIGNLSCDSDSNSDLSLQSAMLATALSGPLTASLVMKSLSGLIVLMALLLDGCMRSPLYLTSYRPFPLAAYLKCQSNQSDSEFVKSVFFVD
jgi:hypothetical protein